MFKVTILRSLLIAYLGVCSIVAHAQFAYIDTVYHNHRYNWEVSYGSIKVTDNKFIVIGYGTDSVYKINIFYIDASGDTLCGKEYWNDSMTEYTLGSNASFDKDRNIIMGGQYYNQITGGEQGLLAKADSNGNIKWIKTYAVSYNGKWGGLYGQSSLVTRDNKYILVCQVGIDSLSSDFLIIKTDTNGNEMNRWEYGGAHLEESFTGIQTNDGGFLLPGCSTKDDSVNHQYLNFTIYIVKSDSSGNQLWSTSVSEPYDLDNIPIGTASAMASFEDTDGYIVCGYKPWQSNRTLYNMGIGPRGWEKLWIGKFSKDSGQLMWEKMYGGDSLDYASFNAISATPDGNFVLCGSYGWNNSYNNAACLYKIDHNGDSIWSATFNYLDSVQIGVSPNSIQTIGTSGYLLSGYVLLDNNTNAFPWVVTIDSSGYLPPDTDKMFTAIKVIEPTVANIKLYPNPTTGQLYLTINTPALNLNPALQIYDVSGRLILNQPQIPVNTPYAIDISNFANGIYFVQLVSGGNIIGRGKVVKE